MGCIFRWAQRLGNRFVLYSLGIEKESFHKPSFWGNGKGPTHAKRPLQHEYWKLRVHDVKHLAPSCPL